VPLDSAADSSSHTRTRPVGPTVLVPSPDAALTTVRFWGWKENAREAAKDKEEMTARVAKGLPVYGESQLTPYMQGVAARNSTWAALNFAVLPW